METKLLKTGLTVVLLNLLLLQFAIAQTELIAEKYVKSRGADEFFSPNKEIVYEKPQKYTDAEGISVFAEKYVKTRGAEVYNVPSEDVFIDKEPLTRGSCIVRLSNSTGYFVEVWIDGEYKGRISPWLNMEFTLQSEFEEIYCRTIGESYKWRTSGQCHDRFNLKVQPDTE